MALWNIEALWDRPAKLLAHSSTHFLLLKITPGIEAPGAGAATAHVSAEAVPEAAAKLPSPGGVPQIAIAIDCSRSMAEDGRFAACAQAAAQLLERCGGCDCSVALFSKTLSPLTSVAGAGPAPAQQLRSALAQVKLRSVSRCDLALDWLAEAVGAPSGPRHAVLLGDGGFTDEAGYDAPAEPLLARARALAGAGVRLWTAGPERPGLLAGLAQASGGSCLDPAALADRLAGALQLATELPARPPHVAPAPAFASAPGQLRLQLDSRQHGLALRRACRLKPEPTCLAPRLSAHGWQLEAGSIAGWQSMELLLEWHLPPAAFGTAEGPDPIVAAALQATDGAVLARCTAGLDYTSDPRRAQQLSLEVDRVRRLWDLAGLDSWTAQATDGLLRRTGVLPPAGPASAPPAGGVPQ